MTATGVAYIAGLAVNFWRDREELKGFQKDYKEFKPGMDPQKRKDKIAKWKKSVEAILKIV
jgi:glycerol kinase